MIAALYVAKGGCYFDLPDVDPWDEARDARTYKGPHPVVAHPPCARWGRYWFGGPSVKVRKVKGDDGGCFAAALASVRRWGGVLEHPAASYAWRHFGLTAPPHRGGWIMADTHGGWTCHVEQGHYGHRARKATWLYAVLPHEVSPPSLIWGQGAARARMDEGFHSSAERAAFRSNRTLTPNERLAKSAAIDEWERRTGQKDFRRLSSRERAATPIPFRDLLLDIARTARAGE